MKKFIILLNILALSSGGMELSHFKEPTKEQYELNYELDRIMTKLTHAYSYSEHSSIVSSIKKLIEKGASVNYTHDEPLIFLTLGDPDLMNYFIEHGANVNATMSVSKNAPLHRALEDYFSMSGSERKRLLETIGLLLKNGADINQRNKNNATPLMHALRTSGTMPAGNVISAILEIVPLLAQKKFYKYKVLHPGDHSYVGLLPEHVRKYISAQGVYGQNLDITIANTEGMNTIDLLRQRIQKYHQNSQAKKIEKIITILQGEDS
jgi:ankyrin repeat protein